MKFVCHYFGGKKNVYLVLHPENMATLQAFVNFFSSQNLQPNCKDNKFLIDSLGR